MWTCGHADLWAVAVHFEYKFIIRVLSTVHQPCKACLAQWEILFASTVELGIVFKHDARNFFVSNLIQ
jgi:hypothetical protein